jgi:hypothetical protein
MIFNIFHHTRAYANIFWGLLHERRPVRRMDRFTVTEHHLKLLRRACVRWNAAGHGAPEVDPERPYGNVDVENDLAEIIGTYAGNRGVLRAIHLQTRIALQIVLCTGQFEPGTYEKTNSGEHTWRKVGK